MAQLGNWAHLGHGCLYTSDLFYIENWVAGLRGGSHVLVSLAPWLFFSFLILISFSLHLDIYLIYFVILFP